MVELIKSDPDANASESLQLVKKVFGIVKGHSP